MPDTLPSGTDLDLCYITLGGTRYLLSTALGTLPYSINVTAAPLVLTANATAPPAILTGTNFQINGANASANRVELVGYGGINGFNGRRANGTAAAPTAVISGTSMVQLGGSGYGTAAWATTSRGIVAVVGAETWSDTVQGTRLDFSTTPAGGTTTAVTLSLLAEGYLQLTKPILFLQAAPTAVTVSATLTAAALLGGIITSNQGAGAAAAYQLPLGTDLEAAMPTNVNADRAFEFSLINISTDAAEDVTITTNTGWTLVGSIAVQSNDDVASKSAGRFRVRRTAANTFTLYRIA